MIPENKSGINNIHTIDRAAKEDWKINDILDYINNDKNKEPVKVLIANDIRWFNIHNFLYNNYKKAYNIELGQDYEAPDYIIIKDEVGNVEGDRYNPLIKRLKNSLDDCSTKETYFSIIKSYKEINGKLKHLLQGEFPAEVFISPGCGINRNMYFIQAI